MLKEAVFAGLKATDPIARRIPSRSYGYEAAELLDVVRHMEEIVKENVGRLEQPVQSLSSWPVR